MKTLKEKSVQMKYGTHGGYEFQTHAHTQDHIVSLIEMPSGGFMVRLDKILETTLPDAQDKYVRCFHCILCYGDEDECNEVYESYQPIWVRQSYAQRKFEGQLVY